MADTLAALQAVIDRETQSNPAARPHVFVSVDADGRGGLTLIDERRANRRLTALVKDWDIAAAAGRLILQIDAADRRRAEHAGVAGFAQQVRA